MNEMLTKIADAIDKNIGLYGISLVEHVSGPMWEVYFSGVEPVKFIDAYSDYCNADTRCEELNRENVARAVVEVVKECLQGKILIVGGDWNSIFDKE